ncbi:hypothetical protein [Allosphingosinicella deserti]|nr:hypothetical protein [Sphingomonas deserti]
MIFPKGRAGVFAVACSGAVAASAVVSACGSGGESGSGGSIPAGWNALDACATLGKTDAAAATGAQVRAATLSTVVEPKNGSAGFSMCTFELANGGKLMLLTREAPSDDATATAIEAARTAGGSMPPARDVPGLGRAALWSEETKGLQLFLDGRRYATINYFAPPGVDPEPVAIAVARNLL